MRLLIPMAVLVVLVFSRNDLSSEKILKREMFLQKLASGLSSESRQVDFNFQNVSSTKNIFRRRSKREITSISNPPSFSVEEAKVIGSRGGLVEPLGELESEPRVSRPCSRQSVRINFEEIGWTHILAPREVSTPQCIVETFL